MTFFQWISETDRHILLSGVALGTSSIITQIVLLREFLSVFYGNELVIGVILANWMLLTAGGSFLGRYSGISWKMPRAMIVYLCALGLLPWISVFLLRYLRNVVFLPGSMVEFWQIIAASFVLLMPFCILSGFLFTLLATTLAERRGEKLVARLYAIEAIGSILGGILFNFGMMKFLRTFESISFLAILDLSAAFYLSRKYGTALSGVMIAVVALVIVVPMGFIDMDAVTKQFLFPDQKVTYFSDTPYGNLVVTKQAEQTNIYENGVLLTSTGDVTQNEEAVHYAMSQVPDPKNVLLISGGITGMISEIKKYPVERIDYVELNPSVIQIGLQLSADLQSRLVHIINEDARTYLKKIPGGYNVVLINLPDPGTTQINRYYTAEFLRELKAKLAPGAVVSFALLSGAEYFSGAANGISSILVKTLKTQFHNVLIVPGMKNYFLASEAPLDLHIPSILASRGIATTYVNKDYVDEAMLHDRSEEIARNLTPDVPVNKDFEPVSYYRQLLFWLRYFNFNAGLLLVICGFGLALVVARANRISVGVLTGGFAASSIEIMLLILFQILYGYVYQIIGIVITAFMAGLAVGSLYEKKLVPVPDIKYYAGIQYCIGATSVVLPLIFVTLQTSPMPAAAVLLLFLAAAFITGLLIGLEFALASELMEEPAHVIASQLYSIDLVGSATGALLTAAILLPWLGVIRVSIVIGALSIISGSLALSTRKKYILVRA